MRMNGMDKKLTSDCNLFEHLFFFKTTAEVRNTLISLKCQRHENQCIQQWCSRKLNCCLQSPICASSKFTPSTADVDDQSEPPRITNNTVIIIQEQTNNQRKKKSKTANTKQLAELIVAYRMSQSPDTKALYRASMTSYDIGQPVLDLLWQIRYMIQKPLQVFRYTICK